MRLNCCCSANTAAVQHMSQAKISLDFKVLIILPWQSAKWTYCADRKMCEQDTPTVHIWQLFLKSEVTSARRAKPNLKWRQNQKDHPDGCVSVWNRPFFNRSHDTLVPNWNPSHQVYGNEWLKVSNSLPFSLLRFLGFLWWDEGEKKSKTVWPQTSNAQFHYWWWVVCCGHTKRKMYWWGWYMP